MVDVTEDRKLWDWLETQPEHVSLVIATRAALRVMPVLWNNSQRSGEKLFLPVFLALDTAVVRALTLEPITGKTFSAAASAFESASAFVDVADVANAAGEAAVADSPAGVFSAIHAARSAYSAADVQADVDFIEAGGLSRKLIERKLWRTSRPLNILKMWRGMKKELIARKEDWDVWTDWYDARLSGTKIDQQLALARVSIDESLWLQGPKIVNAEIKRLIEEYDKPHDLKPETQKTPSIPSVRPAAIMPVWRADKLIINQTALIAEATPETIETALRALHVEMLDLLEDLEAGTNADPWFLKKLRQLSELAATTHPTQFELFRLAHGQEIFVGYSNSVNEQWPEFLASRFHALNLHFSRCINKFPQWKAFVQTASEIELTEEQVQNLPALVQGTVEALRDPDAKVFIDDSLPAALETLGEPLVANDETKKDVISSINNILKSIGELALKVLPIETVKETATEYKKHAKKSLKKEAGIWGDKTGPAITAWVKKWVKRGGVGTIGAGTAHIAFSQIIHKFPEIAEWLRIIDPFL